MSILLKIAKYFGKNTTTAALCHEIIDLGNKIAKDSTLTGKSCYLLCQEVFYEQYGANPISSRRAFIANLADLNYDACSNDV